MLFPGRKKAVKRKGVFPDMRVDQQSDFGAEIAKCGKRGERHGNQIADAADIENDLIGPFFEQTAAEESDHRLKVLPLGRGGVSAGKACALFRVMRRNFVEQVNQGKSRGGDFYRTALDALVCREFLSLMAIFITVLR